MKNIPILILHGWNLSSSNFGALQKELINKGFKVYCIDLPGFGATETPKISYQLSDYVEFVKEFLVKNNLRKIILIGHSFGGRISIKLTSQSPKLVHAMILTGAPGVIPVKGYLIIFFRYLAKIGNALFSLPFISIFKNKAREILYKTASAHDYLNTKIQLKETFQNIVKENLKPYLPMINVPTLLLWGRGDRLVPLRIATRMERLIKNSKLIIINGARHGVPWTHPKEFAGEVEKFLINL